MQANPNRYVVIGATSGIAHACCRLWAERGPAEFVLVCRDADRGQMLAADLQARGIQTEASVITADFASPEAIATLARDLAQAGPIDTVLIAHGSLPDQRNCQDNLAACRDALYVNGVSPALFAEAFTGELLRADHGRLCIIGSVAGDRGRQSNYAYGAAKGLIDRFAQGLQHRAAGTRVRITLAKPGPTDTPMTSHLKQKGARLASADTVARRIVQGIDQGKPVVYAPAAWALIMLIVRLLPRALFHKTRL